MSYLSFRLIDVLQLWQTPCATSSIEVNCSPHAQQMKVSYCFVFFLETMQLAQMPSFISSIVVNCFPHFSQKRILSSTFSFSNFVTFAPLKIYLYCCKYTTSYLISISAQISFHVGILHILTVED